MKNIISLIICIALLCGCSYIIIKRMEESNNLGIKEDAKNNTAITTSKSDYKKNIQIAINKDIILENLRNICLSPRKYGTEGENTTIKYLEDKLNEYGYITNIKDFTVYKQDFNSTIVKYSNEYYKKNPYNSKSLGTGKNLTAIRDNYNEENKTIYLTAHYDTTTNTTGVIDNGTGVSVILEVARQLRYYDGPFNLKIVLFSAEEYFRSGSRDFISNLSAKEKENALACINVDMVGEKDAGKLIMRANIGEHNILTLMINHQQDKQLPILEGGYSDELSFYLNKIPAITLTNINPNPNRAKEKNQLQYVDLGELYNTAYLIANFLFSFDINVYEKFLNERRFISNKVVNNIGLADAYKARSESVIDGFKLTKTNAVLLENGYDSETEYIYENKNGKKYIITEKSIVFIHPSFYSSFKVLDSNYKNSLNYKCLYLLSEDTMSNTKVLFAIGNYFREIKGDMSTDEAMNILRAYYKEEYERIFGSQN